MMDKSDQVNKRNRRKDLRCIDGKIIPLRRKDSSKASPLCPAECSKRMSISLRYLEQTELDTPVHCNNQRSELIHSFNSTKIEAVESLKDLYAILQRICTLDNYQKRNVVRQHTRLQQKGLRTKPTLVPVNCQIVNKCFEDKSVTLRKQIEMFDVELFLSMTDNISDTTVKTETANIKQEITHDELENGISRTSNEVTIKLEASTNNMSPDKDILLNFEPLRPEIEIYELSNNNIPQSDIIYVESSAILNDLNMYTAKAKASPTVTISTSKDISQECENYTNGILSILKDEKPLIELTESELYTELGVLNTVHPTEDIMHNLSVHTISLNNMDL